MIGVIRIGEQSNFLEKLCTASNTAGQAESSTSVAAPNEAQASSATQADKETTWKPLLLMIPLRLGLSEINPIYFQHLKVTKSFSCVKIC